jgi:hypothetical protein
LPRIRNTRSEPATSGVCAAPTYIAVIADEVNVGTLGGLPLIMVAKGARLDRAGSRSHDQLALMRSAYSSHMSATSSAVKQKSFHSDFAVRRSSFTDPYHTTIVADQTKKLFPPYRLLMLARPATALQTSSWPPGP